jgi:hypothetical protein
VLKFDKLVQEDLNIGTGPVWITSPGGGEVLSTQVGLHSFARGQKQYTATWAPGAIAAGSSASTTLAVPDSVPPDFVMASHDKVLTNDLRISGNVSAEGVVQVVIHNPTAASITVASGTVSVVVLPIFPPVTFAVVTGVVTLNGSPVADAYVTVLELPATVVGTYPATGADGVYRILVPPGTTGFSRGSVDVGGGTYKLADSSGYTTALYVDSVADVAITNP